MLDTINNMLATHSAIQQRENKAVEPDRKSSEKFSDHVSAADDQSQKDRRKPEDPVNHKEDDKVAQKQDTDKTSAKKETSDSGEVKSDNTAASDGEEKEIDFETALLLLNEIQDEVEDGVEFVQVATEGTDGLHDENAQGEGEQLGLLTDALGEDDQNLQAGNLTNEVKAALQNGEQQAGAGEGEKVADGELKAAPKEYQLNTNADKAQSKQGELVVNTLDRSGKQDLSKANETGKNSNTEGLIENEDGEFLVKDPQSSKSNDSSEGNNEKKAQVRFLNAQAQASQNAANNLSNAGLQNEAGLNIIQNNQALNTVSQLGLTQMATTQQTQQVPVNNVAMHIAAQAQNGAKRFDIQLDPPELGRIDVRLDVAKDGSVNTHIFVERSETLDLMQRDAKALEKALHDAGLNMKEGNLQFSLKEEGFQGEGFESENNNESSEEEGSEADIVNLNMDHVMNLYRQSGGMTGLDIRV